MDAEIVAEITENKVLLSCICSESKPISHSGSWMFTLASHFCLLSICQTPVCGWLVFTPPILPSQSTISIPPTYPAALGPHLHVSEKSVQDCSFRLEANRRKVQRDKGRLKNVDKERKVGANVGRRQGLRWKEAKQPGESRPVCPLPSRSSIQWSPGRQQREIRRHWMGGGKRTVHIIRRRGERSQQRKVKKQWAWEKKGRAAATGERRRHLQVELVYPDIPTSSRHVLQDLESPNL